ncbi:hypothetical protein VPH35_039914 [Triticum aestivum]
MELFAFLFRMVALIPDALRNAEKLPGALILCGVVEAAVALFLIISRTPGGIFVHHGKVPFYLYYGILIAIVIFGLVEASAGFWASGDVVQRRAAAKTILWVSILPLVVVAALAGFVVLN